MRGLPALSVLIPAAVLGLAGCGNYQRRTEAARGAYWSGDFARSAELYQQQGRGEGRDRLLYLLETGMALHAGKQYQESNQCFLKADRVIEELNFTHVGAGAIAVLTDDRALPYAGEEFEDVLVNTFAALNFLLAGGPKGPEEALIECRRLDWKLRQFAELRKRKYLQNAFARYLSGVAYELDREANDAYIDYKMVHQLRPDFEPVKQDLVRLAHRLGFADEAAEWEQKFNLKHDPEALADTGEVVLFYQCGRAPVKVQREKLLDLPIYRKERFVERGAELLAGGAVLARTQVLEDIEATAVKTLEDRMVPIVARRAASLALKAGVAAGVRQVVANNTNDSAAANLAGILTFELLKATAQADLRCWLTLPANLQVARARLPAGTHSLELRFLDGAGNPTAHRAEITGVVVRAGEITILEARSLK